MGADITSADHSPEVSRHCIAIAEHAPLPMATVEGDRHIVRYANPAFCRLMEKPIGQLVGKPFDELLPEKDQCAAMLARVFRTGKPESHTETEHSKAHPIFWSYTIWPVLADKGLVGVMIQVIETTQVHEKTVAMNEALLLGSLRQHELTEVAENLNAQQRVEITAREKIALDLAEKARLLDLTDDAIIVRDVKGRITYWNHGAEVLYGWPSEKALGKDSHTLLHTEFPSPMTLEQIIGELHRNGRWTGELVHTTRDGRRITVLVRKSLDRDSDGNPSAVLQTLTDISERKRVEAALLASEERFRMMANAMPQLAWMARPDGHIFWYNQRWYDYTGMAPEEMEGWGWQSVHEAVELPKVLDRWKASIATGVPFEMTFPLRGADGSFRPFLTRVIPLKDATGRVMQWFGTNTDVSELIRTEEALREAKEAAEAANRSKDRFLAVLSHELRTPLTPVLMAVAALEHDPELRRDVREDMVMIKRNIEMEVKFIDDLLDVSRIASGKVPLKIEPLDLNNAVLDACATCRSQLRGQNVRLELELSEDLGIIAADPVRLQQVLSNVLRNAIKFTPEQGTIRVTSTRLGPARCEVRVRDSGMGIPPEVLPHIFDAFEQGDARVTRQFGGLGLGLTIAKALVELHGGAIRAESAGSGQGATFIIELPGEHPAVAAAAPPTEPEGGVPAQLRLLIVEDHDDTARALSRLLGKAGFVVSVAGDVASTLALAGRKPFDLVISDLGLPDGSGYDMMAALQKVQPLPGIAMSGYGMDEDVLRSWEAGFREHLVKPIEVPKLIAAIRRVMEPKV